MENHKYGKTAEESSPTMDSKENILGELDSLHEKFEHRIEERSAYNRSMSSGTPPQEEIENLNKLKLHRTRLKNVYQRILNANEQEWLPLRAEARNIVEEAKILLGSPQPSKGQ